MMKPSIHMNGTAREALLDGYINAGAAVRLALEALAAAAPNGRDYYVQGGDGPLNTALGEHYDRMARLESVRRDLVELAEHVAG